MDTDPGSLPGLTPTQPPSAGRVRVGVAGWSYPDWEGIVYPRGRVDGLALLSRYFDTIEVNSSFYRIPPARTTASWPERVRARDGFRFAVKLFRGFTHDRRSGAPEERSFREAMAPLVESRSLGALLVQFPWSFKNVETDRRYLTELLDRFASYPLVVELRHQSWDRPEVFDLLRERGAGFCNIDQPVIGRSLGPTRETTSPVGYVRLHGRNYESWFDETSGRDERYDYLYSETELDPWLDKISEIRETASETFVITNNHFRGQAVVNALQIRRRLAPGRVAAPRALVEHYPVLAGRVEVEEPDQGRLF